VSFQKMEKSSYLMGGNQLFNLGLFYYPQKLKHLSFTSDNNNSFVQYTL
jgi:hypothetical protein